MLAKVSNKDTATVVAALAGQGQHLPRELHRSLTWDRGKVLAGHKRLALATGLDVDFCDPNSLWQRGTAENTNRILRQHSPRPLASRSTARPGSPPSHESSTSSRERH